MAYIVKPPCDEGVISLHQDVQCSDFGDGMRAALHIELATDIEDVFFHCVDTEDEVISDLAVGRAIYHQAQHLALPSGERVYQLTGAGGGAGMPGTRKGQHYM